MKDLKNLKTPEYKQEGKYAGWLMVAVLLLIASSTAIVDMVVG